MMKNHIPYDSTVSHTMTTCVADDAHRINIAIYGVIFIILVTVGRVQEIIPGLMALKLGKVSFVLALVLYFISPTRGEISLFSTPQMKYFSALLLLGFVSIPFSLWPVMSFNFMVYSFATTYLLVFLVIKVVTTYADLKKIAWTVVISIILLSLIALLEGGKRISSSSTYDPNDMALVILLFTPLIYFMMKNAQTISKLLLSLILIISLTSIVMTQSRGGFLGLIVIIFGILIKEHFNLKKLLFVATALFVAFFYFAPEGYSDRLSSIFIAEKDYNRTAQGGRIEIWKRGLAIMIENPLLGVGPASFVIAEGAKHEEHGLTGRWMTAHNSFVQIGAELGIAGLVFFVMILYTSISSLRRALRKLPADSELCWLINSLELGFYGYITASFFLSQAYITAFFLLVGLTIVVVHLVESSTKKDNDTMGIAN